MISTEAAEKGSDLLTAISQTETSVVTYIQDYILSLTIIGASNWVFFITSFPLLVWIAITGWKVMLGAIKGDALRKEMMRVFMLLMIVFGGSAIMGGVNIVQNQFSTYISKFASSTSQTVRMTHTSESIDLKKWFSDTELEDYKSYKSKPDPTAYAPLSLKISSKIESLFSDKSQRELINDGYTKDPSAMTELKKTQDLAGLVDIAKGADTGILSPQEFAEEYFSFRGEQSLLSQPFSMIVAYCLQCAGGLFKLLMRVFQLLLMGLMQIVFPLAITLSLIPTMEKTWESWLQNYIGIMLLGVTLSVINGMMGIIHASVMAEPLFSILMMFVTGVMYLLAPAISVILFGGSGSISGLPGQIVQTGAATTGVASKIFNKVTSLKNSPLRPTK